MKRVVFAAFAWLRGISLDAGNPSETQQSCDVDPRHRHTSIRRLRAAWERVLGGRQGVQITIADAAENSDHLIRGRRRSASPWRGSSQRDACRGSSDQ
jgi:hypothetical protein